VQKYSVSQKEIYSVVVGNMIVV